MSVVRLRVGREHRDGLHRALQAAGGVDPRREAEADIPGGQGALLQQAGDLDQGPQPFRAVAIIITQ